MTSKNQIFQRAKKKTNPKIVETLALCKKKNQLLIGKKISGPTRLQTDINLSEINKLKEDKIVVCGKVLGQGDIESKKTIIALSFSKQALDKLKKAKCEVETIIEALEKNANLKDYKII